MRSFILGIFLGMCFDETVTTLAKNLLSRPPQQEQFDMEHMRTQLDFRDSPGTPSHTLLDTWMI